MRVHTVINRQNANLVSRSCSSKFSNKHTDALVLIPSKKMLLELFILMNVLYPMIQIHILRTVAMHHKYKHALPSKILIHYSLNTLSHNTLLCS